MGKFKPNSYFFFMQEQKRLKPAWKGKSNQELMVLCGQGWEALSPQQRRRFEDMKAEYNNKDPEARERERLKGEVRIAGGYDTHGNSLVGIKKRDLERLREVKDKIDAVTNMVGNAAHSGTLETTKFYVMETNVFVKIDGSDQDQIFVPAEVSIAKFSLHEGVAEVYQAFPAAGEIPLGYKRECLENSDKRHKIPLEEAAENPMNSQVLDEVEFKHTQDAEILQDVSIFLSGGDVVFCMPEKTAQCEGVLRTLAKRSNLRPPSILILPLPELLFRLANMSQEGSTLPSAGVAERELESERFLYKAGLSCPWHEAMTDTNTCSSATVWRMCFTVLDLCCQHYKIPLVSGRHIPRTVETEPIGKEWYVSRDTTSRQTKNNVVRSLSGFASEDVRFREEQVVDDCKQDEGQLEAEATTDHKMKPMQVYSEKAKREMGKDMQQAGTISDYMGAVTESVSNLSVVSDCSSDSEFVTLDSISQASVTMARMQPAVVVEKGVGRGAVLPGRGPSRMAATFPAIGAHVRECPGPRDCQ